MLKYCKVINEETKEVNIGLGTNIDFYKSIGFEEREITEVNNRYYLKNYEPDKDMDEIKKEKETILKNNIEKSFYEKYPLYKQCNIAIFGTEEERNKFKEFHDKLVKEYDKEVAKL